MLFDPDPEYNLVEVGNPLPRKRGNQCGQCGMKFDYGTTYGYYCSDLRCPMMSHRCDGWATTGGDR
jgi:hypothetical protein